MTRKSARQERKQQLQAVSNALINNAKKREASKPSFVRQNSKKDNNSEKYSNSKTYSNKKDNRKKLSFLNSNEVEGRINLNTKSISTARSKSKTRRQKQTINLAQQKRPLLNTTKLIPKLPILSIIIEGTRRLPNTLHVNKSKELRQLGFGWRGMTRHATLRNPRRNKPKMTPLSNTNVAPDREPRLVVPGENINEIFDPHAEKDVDRIILELSARIRQFLESRERQQNEGHKKYMLDLISRAEIAQIYARGWRQDILEDMLTWMEWHENGKRLKSGK